MRPVTVSVTGNGTVRNSDPVVVDFHISPLNLGLSFNTNGNTTGFKVQYSLDDPWGAYVTSYNVNAVWYDHASMVSMTANASGSVITPVRAVRLQGNVSGTDTGTLTVVQAGGP